MRFTLQPSVSGSNCSESSHKERNALQPLTTERVARTLSEHFIRYLLDLFFRLIKSSELRGLTPCVVRDALLHTTVVMCRYLRYCHLLVSFDQSGPDPPTSLINNAFLPTELFAPFSPNSVCEHPRRLAVSEILNPPSPGTNKHSTVKIT